MKQRSYSTVHLIQCASPDFLPGAVSCLITVAILVPVQRDTPQNRIIVPLQHAYTNAVHLMTCPPLLKETCNTRVWSVSKGFQTAFGVANWFYSGTRLAEALGS